MTVDCEYAIIGGGVAGLSMAYSLTTLGKSFLVYERSRELKGIGAGFGLAANAMQAFEYLGLRGEVEKIGYYTSSFQILDQRGSILVDPDTVSLSKTYKQSNFTVHRADLHLFLLSKVDIGAIYLGKKALRFEHSDNSILVYFEDGSTCRCKYLIVADGVKSALRQQLVPSALPRYTGYTCWRATIDNDAIGLIHGSETWGRSGRFGMTPLTQNRVYWYACINSPINNTVYKNFQVSDLQKQFENYHRPIPEILRSTQDKDLIWNDIMDIKPLTRFAYGPIVLIGDAAHATTPNLGQGACQALEDVAVLTDEICSATSIETAFLRFERRRLSRTKYIIDTSRQIGRAAQWTNPMLVKTRNILLRMSPASWSQGSIKKLLDTDFMTLNKYE